MSLLRSILSGAVRSGASDIHVKSGGPLHFRIHGELVPVQGQVISEEVCRQLLEEVVPPHLKEVFQRDHEADFSLDVEGVGRFRANVFLQRGSPSMALRHVKADIPSLDSLFLPDILKTVASNNDGIIIVSGSTGSGKSTTLAGMVDHVNRNFRRHVVTLEDPIEYVFTDGMSVINQREVGLDTLSFQSALVNVMRQDPDVIVIGEIRDDRSVLAALRAAETGHLVMTTLHSTTAPQVVTRLLDFFSPDSRDQVRRQLALCLRAVTCQKLVAAADREGVYPAVEILVNVPIVRKLLEENRLEKLAAVIETGQEEGMQNFNQALLKLCQLGRITPEEATRQAPNPEVLQMNLKGIFLSSENRILG